MIGRAIEMGANNGSILSGSYANWLGCFVIILGGKESNYFALIRCTD